MNHEPDVNDCLSALDYETVFNLVNRRPGEVTEKNACALLDDECPTISWRGPIGISHDLRKSGPQAIPHNTLLSSWVVRWP